MDPLITPTPNTNEAPTQPSVPAPDTLGIPTAEPVNQVIGLPQVDPALFATPSEPMQTMNMPEAPTNPATAATPNIGGDFSFGATDPLTMPTPPKAPDPIEEELKAPLKAADPVPGSIASAIPGPGTQMPMKSSKKKMDKNTLILMGAVGAMVVIALVAVLIIQLNS